MLCLKNRSKQLPNCLNTVWFCQGSSQTSFVDGFYAGIVHVPAYRMVAVLQGDGWRE